MVNNSDINNEKQKLDYIAKNNLYFKGVGAISAKYCFNIITRFFKGGTCLELGPADGFMTQYLIQYFNSVSCVEGSKILCENLMKNFKDIIVINSLFEEFETEKKFDAIILGHVLEHVEDPVLILKKAKNWLTHEGKIFVAVPNARSIHRQAAVIMGLLKNECELNETDHSIGHRRVYTPESLRGEFIEAGLKIEHYGGYWLKPLSNTQIDSCFTDSMIDAFMVLGERYPDIAAEIYVVARG